MTHAQRVSLEVAQPAAMPEPPRAPLRDDHLWTQNEAAYFLGVSARYLRESSCPKVLLPGNGAKGQSIVRYRPDDVRAWADNWSSGSLTRSA